MKKIFSIPLIIIYLFALAGPTIKMHYCSGELVDWKFLTSNEAKTGCCDMPIDENCGIIALDNDCCEDVVVQLQLDSELNPIVSNYFDYHIDALLSTALSDFQYDSPIEYGFYETVHGLSPPLEGLWQDRSLYELYNCRKIDC